MSNPFSFILKHKKVILSLLLFFVISGAVLPTIALAEDRLTNENNIGWFSPGKAIVLALNDGISYLCYSFSKMSADLFTYVLTTLMSDKWSITKDRYFPAGSDRSESTTGGAVFLTAWNIVKNWANMLIAIGLIASAIAIMLRIGENIAKKMLTGVIIIAILVNFSILFCGIMIDLSNIIMKSLVANGGDITSLVGTVNTSWNRVVWGWDVSTWTGVLGKIGMDALFNIMYMLIALSLLFLTLTYIQRYIILAILFTLSPLAFVLRAIPFGEAQKLWTNWWSHFIKWCFIGIGGAFILNLAVNILHALTFNVVSRSTDLRNSGGSSFIFSIVIVMGFLIVGLRSVIKSSGPVTNAIMDGAKATVKIATGAILTATGAGTGAALKTTGITGAAQRLGSAARNWASDWSTSNAEKFGILSQGTLAKTKIDRAKQNMGQYEEAMANLARVAPGANPDEVGALAMVENPIGAPAVRQKAAAIKQLVKDGKLGKYFKTAEAQANAIKYAQRHYDLGYDKELWEKAASKNPDLAALNDVAIKENMKKLVGRINPKTGVAYTENDMDNKTPGYYDDMHTQAQNMATRDAALKYDNPDIKKRTDADNIAVVLSEIKKNGHVGIEGAEIIDHLSEKGALGKLDKVLGGLDKLAIEINHITDKYGSVAKKGLLKIAPHLADQDTELVKEETDKILVSKGTPRDTATPIQISTAETEAKRELRRKANSKIEARDINNLTEDAINIEFIEDTTNKKLGKADNLSNDQIKLLQELAKKGGEINKAINAAKASGDTQKVDELRKKRKTIKALNLR